VIFVILKNKTNAKFFFKKNCLFSSKNMHNLILHYSSAGSLISFENVIEKFEIHGHILVAPSGEL